MAASVDKVKSRISGPNSSHRHSNSCTNCENLVKTIYWTLGFARNIFDNTSTMWYRPTDVGQASPTVGTLSFRNLELGKTRQKSVFSWRQIGRRLIILTLRDYLASKRRVQMACTEELSIILSFDTCDAPRPSARPNVNDLRLMLRVWVMIGTTWAANTTLHTHKMVIRSWRS